MLFMAGLWLAGCDYTVSLVETPSVPIDEELAGLWQRTRPDGGTEQMTVLPMGLFECLVIFPRGAKEVLFARVALWREGDLTLAQLNWLGSDLGEQPKDNRTYQYAAYTVADDALTVRLLDPAVISRDALQTTDLVKAIQTADDNPKRFREPMKFQRVGTTSE